MSNTIKRLKSALSDTYAVERELGTGGMATVYLAEDVKHKRKVAVKYCTQRSPKRSAQSGSCVKSRLPLR